MKTRLSIQLREDSNLRVAAYESMLDLFTLITFVLIVAAMLYATRVYGQGKAWASVKTGIVQKGSGVPSTLPDNTITIVIYRNNSTDMISFIRDTSPIPDQRSVKQSDINLLMDGFASVFNSVKNINVVVHNGNEKADGNIYLAVASWLAMNKHNYNFVVE